MSDDERIFTRLYSQNSGPGSGVAYSAPYRAFLAAFLAEHKIRSILDLGCGDMEIMGRVELQGATYLGVDVIAGRIAANRRLYPHLAFEHADLASCELRAADLVLCKDVLQHWPTARVMAFLERLERARCRFALLTNCNYGRPNTEVDLGGWRPLDLTAPPFSCGSVVFRWGTRESGGIKDVVLFKWPTTEVPQ